jgi:hypothetical protein
VTRDSSHERGKLSSTITLASSRVYVQSLKIALFLCARTFWA